MNIIFHDTVFQRRSRNAPELVEIRSNERIQGGTNVKKQAAILLALMMLLLMSACGQAPDRELGEEQQQESNAEEAAEEKAEDDKTGETKAEEEPFVEVIADSEVPKATSEDVELYVVEEANGHSYVVNRYGENAAGYSLDELGNLLGKNGELLVMKDNLSSFRAISELSFAKSTYQATMDAREEPVGGDENVTRVNQYAVNLTVRLNFKPDDASNSIILIRSTENAVAEIRVNNNRKYIVDGEFQMDDGEIAIQPDDPSKPINLIVTAKYPGETKLIARALTGEARAECSVNVRYGGVDSIPVPTETPTDIVNASGDATQHVHSYICKVVEPTIWEKGYTLYTCPECGYSFQDNFTSKLPAPEPTPAPHVHSYRASVVAPTESERGYTLYICDECGDTYKDNFVQPTGS